MAALVDRKVIDVTTKEELTLESDFIELLTHKTYAIQVRRLPEKRKTQLEKFMTLFNQAWISDKNYILDLEEVPEEFNDIAKYLNRPLADKKLLQELEAEEEIEDYFAEQEAEIKQAWQKVDDQRKQKEKAVKQKEEAVKQKEEAMIKLAKTMKKFGESIETISKETGLSPETISRL